MADRVDCEEAVLLDHPNGLVLEGKERANAHHDFDVFPHLNYNHSYLKPTATDVRLNSIESY